MKSLSDSVREDINKVKKFVDFNESKKTTLHDLIICYDFNKDDNLFYRELIQKLSNEHQFDKISESIYQFKTKKSKKEIEKIKEYIISWFEEVQETSISESKSKLDLLYSKDNVIERLNVFED